MSSSFVASGEKNTKSRMVEYITTPGLFMWLASALALGQTTLSIPGLPGTLRVALAYLSFPSLKDLHAQRHTAEINRPALLWLVGST
jgi:hypothetical protein